jgi:hypothetical protein
MVRFEQRVERNAAAIDIQRVFRGYMTRSSDFLWLKLEEEETLRQSRLLLTQQTASSTTAHQMIAAGEHPLRIPKSNNYAYFETMEVKVAEEWRGRRRPTQAPP